MDPFFPLAGNGGYEHAGGPTAQEVFDEWWALPESDEVWNPAPNALPGPADLVATPVYLRGATTLHALRVKVGDPVFFRILRSWYRQNRDGNVTTGDSSRSPSASREGPRRVLRRVAHDARQAADL